MFRLCRHNRRGMTLVEVMVAMGITTLMVTCTVAMLLQTVRRCETEVTQGGTDNDAVLAMQMMIGDIREAKRVTPLNNNTQLMIIKPIRAQQGYYDRSAEDTLHPVNYYLSDSSHVVGRTGTYLWRSEVLPGNRTEYRCIRKGVDPNGLLFTPDVPKSIQITIKVKSNVSHGASGEHRKDGGKNLDKDGIYTQLVDRVVYLRNY